MAQKGVIDLSGWDMETNGPVNLDGEWEIYWNRLLTPADFSEAKSYDASGLYRTPGPWNAVPRKGNEAGGTGHATLRLHIMPGPLTGPATLRLFNIYSAYVLWADGRVVARSGEVGSSAQEERAHPSNRLVTLNLDGKPLELVLQVSNYHYRDGGLLSSICLGPQAMMLTRQNRASGIAMFVVGAFLVMGLYHFVLFFFRKKNASPLYFALYCLIWAGFLVMSDFSEWAILLFFPDLGAQFMEHVALACFFVSLPIGLLFFRSLYPREFSLVVLRFSAVLAAVFVILAVAASTLTLTSALPIYFGVSACLIAYSLARLFKAWRLGREGAAFIFGGFLILGLAGVNDMLVDLKLVGGGSLLAPGMLAFMLFQAIALSQRFSKAFSSVETLSFQLEDKNLRLETEIAERSRLEREIVNISEEERRRMSQDLHDGLCQQLTGARLRCSVLERMPQKDKGEAQALAQLSTLLDRLVDQAYDLSCGLWPLEHDPTLSGSSLADLARRFSRSNGIPVEFRQELACEACTNPHITQLHRIAQEALANAVKHANPTQITVSFACTHGESATLTVQDNGRGRAKAAKSRGGLGTSIMKHRARMIDGILRIEDGPKGGTVVTCTAPCETKSKPASKRTAA